ncbi:tripartite tricarboxylate transporter substrate binding protein [Cryobacterium lactosi]|uniref:Tripartite tricarboxylate transporter substrate binding protein n=1 Tax=Cryobacterium lactosi TaxID=1259202 RepID=A0A4R9C0C3_9MICO|nr:tripartite tricarboxylate transporter substrate-binding protein [Cryobacterium lactosi]TFD95230.1 tripartite tricarboxylate transporter substrate binding protein [Cryobacterium lactosi]
MKQVLRTIAFSSAVALITGLAVANAAATGSSSTVRNKLTVMAPASPGGGWDGFSRESQAALRSEGIVNNVQVANVPGAGGTIGLSQLVQMSGRDDILMATGGVMIGAVSLGDTPESLQDVTPIARVADDYAALVVPADSPITSLDDFIEVWQADPEGTSIAGGSLGSIDHLMTGLLAGAIGLDPEQANYIAYSGGGEALSALLSHTTTGGISGYNEISGQVEAGQLRVLAVSSPERMPGVEVPTFMELGVDVTMSNWRGYVAPPGLDEAQTAELAAIVEEMQASSAWREVLKRNNWTDSYLVGPDFEAFLVEQQTEIDTIIEELGL